MILISVAGCADTSQSSSTDMGGTFEGNEEERRETYRVFPTESKLSPSSNPVEWGSKESLLRILAYRQKNSLMSSIMNS
jgi:hypothetical protein